MNVYQSLFDKVASDLPEGWAWFTIRCAYSEDRTTRMIHYGKTQDKLDRDGADISGLGELLDKLRDMIAPPPLEQFTHIELTFNSDGNHSSVLGYGEPNLDVMPIPWPDDITAEEYTYIGAWPNGLAAKRVALLNDPRSSKGVAIVPDE